MKSHILADKLLSLPDQFVYINTPGKDPMPCAYIIERVNGLFLSPIDIVEKGGEA